MIPVYSKDDIKKYRRAALIGVAKFVAIMAVSAFALGCVVQVNQLEAQIAVLKSDHNDAFIAISELRTQIKELETAAEAKEAELNEPPVSRGGNVRYTLEEVMEMAKVVHKEAEGESPFGKMLVARVIMNRVEANPGMTADDIINRKGAFVKADTFDSEDLHAVFEAMTEKRYPGIFTFFNPETATNKEFVANKMQDVVLRVGKHVFCE